jgi:hypothetical protein
VDVVRPDLVRCADETGSPRGRRRPEQVEDGGTVLEPGFADVEGRRDRAVGRRRGDGRFGPGLQVRSGGRVSPSGTKSSATPLLQ